MKSSREQFEEWAKSSGSDMERYKTGINKGDFKNPVMRKMWLAWQASRAAIVVTLPDCDDYQSTWQYQDAAEVRIKEQGVSVK